MTEDAQELWTSSLEELCEGQVPGKAGYIWKRGEPPHRDYKLRWFELDNLGSITKSLQLTYYEDESRARRKGAIALGKIEKVEEGPWEDSVEGSLSGFVLVLYSPDRIWELKCSTELIRNRWAMQLKALCLGEVHPMPRIEPLTDEWDWRRQMERKGDLVMRATVTRGQMMRENGGGLYTAYLVLVETNAGFMFRGETRWIVYRRFSDFQELHRDIMQLAEFEQYAKDFNKLYPTLPARDWTGRFSAHVIEYRRQSFHHFLDYVFSCLRTYNSGLSFFPLRLREFLSPPAIGEVLDEEERPLKAPLSIPKVTVEPASEVAHLPSIFRFQPMVLYPSRHATLTQYLQGLHEPLSSAQAYSIVVAVAQYNPAHRAVCIKELYPHVSDPHRFFLLFQDLPPHVVAELSPAEKADKLVKKG